MKWNTTAPRVPGTTSSRMKFKKIKPGDMSLTFFIDGTGANGNRIDVQQKIEEFQKVTGYNGRNSPAELSQGGLGHVTG